jgi:hypothetical protein
MQELLKILGRLAIDKGVERLIQAQHEGFKEWIFETGTEKDFGSEELGHNVYSSNGAEHSDGDGVEGGSDGEHGNESGVEDDISGLVQGADNLIITDG